MRKVLIGALAAALLLSIPALAARPPGGAKYRGKTSQERTIDLRVTRNAVKGLQLEFDEVLSCNRGPRQTTHATYREQRPTIRRDGTFEYFKTYRDLDPVPGFQERHTERQRITGSFSADNRRVRGRIANSVVGDSGLRCKVELTFSARRIP